MLDTSKAFDKVNFGKLFMLLLHRKLPAIIIRFLMDNYTRQRTVVKWNNQFSAPFEVQNGVKQGALPSPILFSIYIGELLLKLESSGLECYVGNICVGTLGYADDLTLLSSSVRCLNRMLKICESFVIGTNVKHLGNTVTVECTDMKYCTMKRSLFICAVNMFIGNFGSIPNQILCYLFGYYCCTFYGSQLWGCSSEGFDRCTVEWNKAIRRVLHVPYRTHRGLLGPHANITEQLHIKTLRFIDNLINHDNPINVST